MRCEGGGPAEPGAARSRPRRDRRRPARRGRPAGWRECGAVRAAGAAAAAPFRGLWSQSGARPARPSRQSYNRAFDARRDGGAVHVRAVRPQPCAARPRRPLRPLQLPAMRGKGRREGRQDAARGMQGVRQEVLDYEPRPALLLGRVPRRRQAAPRPGVHAQVHGRPREARRNYGPHEGRRCGPQGQGEGREAAAAAAHAAAGGPQCRARAAPRGSRRAVHMQDVRPQLCDVRPHPPFLLQAMHGQGRQGGRKGLARKVRRVRQGILRDPFGRPLLLGCVQRRRQEPLRPRAQAQARSRTREARRRAGPRGGAGRARRDGEEGAAAVAPQRGDMRGAAGERRGRAVAQCPCRSRLEYSTGSRQAKGRIRPPPSISLPAPRAGGGLMHPASAAARRACTLPVPARSPAPSFPVPPPWRFPP